MTSFYIATIPSVAAQISQEKKYDRNKIVLHALEGAVQAKYGKDFEVGFHIMDSLIANSLPDEITDPYHTLTGCILFSAWHSGQSEDSVVTGIYKDGQILWDDYPGTKAGFGSALFATKDINRDGDVDILEAEADFTLMTRQGSGISYLWILSWNGTTGRLINDVDSLTHQSTLVSVDGVYDLVDINRDGIMEIKGEIDSAWQEYFPNLNPSTLPNITYSWNGSKYGFSPSAHQISKNEFYPANLMGVSVHCVVSIENSEYTYGYTWTNQPDSKQGIENIYVGGLADTCSNHAPAGWHASSSSYVGGRYFYNSTFDILGTISPGHSLAGFGTVSISPPTMVKYYVQGFRWFGQTATDEEYRNDILTNSVSGYTLGTSDTTQPSVSSYVLDSLKSYVAQSRSLGWIASQSSADTYARFIDTAKAQLQRNDSLSARRALDSIMQHAVADSASVLTSEAFALIFFNAQYLLAQMPPAPPHHTITATAGPNGSISPRGNITVNDGESITIMMSPNPGFRIAGVFIDNANTSVGTDPTYAFKNVTADHQISASFTANQYVITSSASRNGSILPSGVVSVSFDSSQTFIFTPDNCCFIDSVIVDGAAQVPPPLRYTFTGVTANHSIKAVFAIHIDTIKAFAGPHGSISPEGTLLVNCGSRRTFIITPVNCYHVARLIVDGAQTDSTASYTFDNISANHAIRAVFGADYDTIMASVGSTDRPAHGTIKPSGTVVVTCWANRTFRMKPNTGYTIQNVVVDGINQGPLNRYTFSHVTSRHTITAYFAVKKYVITASAGTGGTISPDGKVEVNYGSNQSFTITPNSGYTVRSVVVDEVSRGAISTYTFTRVAANHTISANFSKRGH